MIDRLPSGFFEQLQDHAGDANMMQIGEAGIFLLGVALCADADHLLARHHFIEQRLALGPAHVQRHDSAGEDDDVADR